MSMVDPLADMYTRIRNATRVAKETVDIPASKIKKEISRVLKEEGFIDNFKVLDGNVQGIIRLKLKYSKRNKNVITDIKQISKPGLRRYVNVDEIPRVLGGLGIAIITTSGGVFTDSQCREKKAGGELLCYVW